jgi:peptidoglycan hydrolase CwlO-like protein
MTDTNPGSTTDTARLDALYNEVKQAVTELKATLQPKLQEMASDVRSKVQELSQRIDQKLDELGAAIRPGQR